MSYQPKITRNKFEYNLGEDEVEVQKVFKIELRRFIIDETKKKNIRFSVAPFHTNIVMIPTTK